MLRRVIISTGLVVLFLTTGAGVFAVLAQLREQPEPIVPERRPLAVSAIQMTPQTLTAPVEGFGTARANRTSTLSAQVSAPVASLAPGLDDGVAVDAQQLLITLDDREYQAQLERARGQIAATAAALAEIDVRETNLRERVDTATSELAVARREYERVLALFEQGTSNPRELDNARLDLQRARRALQALEGELAAIAKSRAKEEAILQQRQAELKVAELNVERCQIHAPYAGRVERLDVEIGEQVRPGQQLLTLLDPVHIEVPIELPVSQRPYVRTGAAAELRLENRPHVVWSANVDRIAPSASESTRTFALYVIVDNEALQRTSPEMPPLMPGMFVAARIAGRQLQDAMLIPRHAIRRRRVFVADGGKAQQREIEIQQRVLDQVAVSGLSPGDIVLTSNLDILADGMPVTPNIPKQPVAARPAESDAREKSAASARPSPPTP